ncbi:MAG TPA: twin-arginine translocase TatA/TatE family subunit [Anaerohalosphaeraceae bacterium]|jgi:sec-independent protein translocase protein TatA|nr:twin-arginine translocase TatA/TatE family subunit [Anaerohalosphaeraceae bacterium]HRT51163.1 twin-arginine translocase TatA/TatE family subunit [Anaerohalosphaeraceae bacterium]HRT87216.1 twin-arginine translocase TatA/TatE family subunit [Anaerohalosphaeraceae bacterium]
MQDMLNTLAFGMPGNMEWLVILAVAVLIFGRRLPEIARGLGKSITEFKKGIREAEKDVDDSLREADQIAQNAGKGPQVEINQD